MVLESIWFIIALLIIAIVLLVDPKSSSMGSGNSSVLRAFSSPRSGQSFIYRFSAVLISSFFILTILLSYIN
jgi:protein translocase SecG subunit|tara:strand:+ start:36 stop:251 length:216 start_codon:yes stop_codon:yes gene_type:complete